MRFFIFFIRPLVVASSILMSSAKRLNSRRSSKSFIFALLWQAPQRLCGVNDYLAPYLRDCLVYASAVQYSMRRALAAIIKLLYAG